MAIVIGLWNEENAKPIGNKITTAIKKNTFYHHEYENKVGKKISANICV